MVAQPYDTQVKTGYGTHTRPVVDVNDIQTIATQENEACDGATSSLQVDGNRAGGPEVRTWLSTRNDMEPSRRGDLIGDRRCAIRR